MNYYEILGVDRGAEQEVIAGSAGVMFMTYAPLGRGILPGRSLALGFAPDDLRSAMPQNGPRNREMDVGVFDALDAIAQRLGITRAAVAPAWTLGTANTTVPLPGARSPSHVTEFLKAATPALTSQDVSELRVLLDRSRCSVSN